MNFIFWIILILVILVIGIVAIIRFMASQTRRIYDNISKIRSEQKLEAMEVRQLKEETQEIRKELHKKVTKRPSKAKKK